MFLNNSGTQQGLHRSYRADGALASSVTPLLVLPQAISRSSMLVMNISGTPMFLEHGCARALVTITAGAVTAITVTNGGFGFTRAPTVEFVGGDATYVANAAWNGRGLPGAQSPSGPTAQPAMAHAVLTGGVVTSIVIDNPGAGYVNPPEVLLTNAVNDPFGCADPSLTAGSGVLLVPGGGSMYINGTTCYTDAVALWGTAAAKFTVEYMP
jgi:hypothetical protein